MTNYQTVKKSIERLKGIEKMSEDGTFEQLTKKERARLTKEKEKLSRDLNGIRDMKGLPQAIFIVDAKKEEIAVQEANKLGIPVVGIVDTNSNPDGVDYVIPGNDDAIRAINLYTVAMADAILAGKSGKGGLAAQDEFVEVNEEEPPVAATEPEGEK